jgi:hypothetical protein
MYAEIHRVCLFTPPSSKNSGTQRVGRCISDLWRVHQPSQTDCHALTSYRPPTRAPVTWLRLSRTSPSRERLVPPSLWLLAYYSRLLHRHPHKRAPLSSPPRRGAASPFLTSPASRGGACFPIRLVRRSSRGLLDPDPARPPVPGTLDPSPCPLVPRNALSGCTPSAHARCDLREGSRDTPQSALLCPLKFRCFRLESCSALALPTLVTVRR